MKPTAFCSLAIFVCSIAPISYLGADPASSVGAGGSTGPTADLGPLDYTAAAPVKTTPQSAVPGGTAQDNTGGSHPDNVANPTTPANPTEQTGKFGRPTMDNPFGNAATAETAGADAAINKRKGGGEKMVVLPEGHSREPAQKSEVARKFEPSLLDAGLSKSHKVDSKPEKSLSADDSLGAPLPPAPQIFEESSKAKSDRFATSSSNPSASASPEAKASPAATP